LIIDILSEGIKTYFMFAKYFYSLCNPVILKNYILSMAVLELF